MIRAITPFNHIIYMSVTVKVEPARQEKREREKNTPRFDITWNMEEICPYRDGTFNLGTESTMLNRLDLPVITQRYTHNRLMFGGQRDICYTLSKVHTNYLAESKTTGIRCAHKKHHAALDVCGFWHKQRIWPQSGCAPIISDNKTGLRDRG